MIIPIATVSFGLAKIAFGTELLMFLVMISRIEFISNLFRPKDKKQIITIKEWLFFTNISLIYTALCVISGFLMNYYAFFNRVYLFLLPTAFILEILVVCMFWPLFTIKPSLVKSNIAPYPNLFIFYLREFPKHLFPLLILLIELQGVNIKKDWAHRHFFIIFLISYFCINELLIHYKKIYLYPFLEALNFISRIVIFFLIGIFCIALYEILAHRVSSISTGFLLLIKYIGRIPVCIFSRTQAIVTFNKATN